MHKLLITSTAAHEGKSTVSNRLAKEKAKSGEKVLLIDLDFMESARIGLGNGLAEYICSRGSISADIVEEDTYDVLLPSKNRTRFTLNPREMVFFEALLSTLEVTYDTAVIDTPPILYVPEILRLCQYCDEIIVVNSGKSNAELALNRLKDAGFQVRIVDNFF